MKNGSLTMEPRERRLCNSSDKTLVEHWALILSQTFASDGHTKRGDLLDIVIRLFSAEHLPSSQGEQRPVRKRSTLSLPFLAVDLDEIMHNAPIDPFPLDELDDLYDYFSELKWTNLQVKGSSETPPLPPTIMASASRGERLETFSF